VATRKKATPREPAAREVKAAAAVVLAALEHHGSKRNVDGMARYGIVARKAFGVSVKDVQAIAKEAGRSHALALALWDSGWYEARLAAAFVDEPARVTAAQMDRWCRDFENWGDCDTVCMHLFDRTPHAWRKVEQWSRRTREYERRAGFALLASLALHDRGTPDAAFVRALPIVEAGADDERNFVKKGVSWALRGIGHRSAGLHAAAIALAERLAADEDRTRRWVGRDVLRDLTRDLVRRRVARRQVR
jgi:3-methyladenine DNA glycosylase AlkD